MIFFFFKQKTAYEMRISDWSSDVCSSDVLPAEQARRRQRDAAAGGFLELAVDVEDGLRELPVQALEALGEGVEVVARASEGGGRQPQGQHDEAADCAHGEIPDLAAAECDAGWPNRREDGSRSCHGFTRMTRMTRMNRIKKKKEKKR